MKRWNPNSVELQVEITPTWQKIIKAFWIGYATILALCLLALILLLARERASLTGSPRPPWMSKQVNFNLGIQLAPSGGLAI